MHKNYNFIIIILISLYQKIHNQNFPSEAFDTTNEPFQIKFPKNCKKISSTSPLECIECNENFTLLNGECPCYDRNCFKCSSSLYGACEKCNINFELDEKTKTCICEFKHCIFCSEDKCDQCETGYELINGECNETNWECYDKGCEICLNKKKGSCKKCFDGFNLESGNCIMNPYLNIVVNNNFLCDKNYYSIGYGCNKNCLGQNCTYGKCENSCLICKENILMEILNCKPLNYCNDSHCVMCRNTEEGFCDRCEIGYRLFEGKCEKCKDKSCLNCDYTEDGSCNSCMFNYTLINGICYSNELIVNFTNNTEEEELDESENKENKNENENKDIENKDNGNKNNENNNENENKDIENKDNENNENKNNENKNENENIIENENIKNQIKNDNENKENNEEIINQNENEEQKVSENKEEEEDEENQCLSGIKINEGKLYCTKCNENYTLIEGKCYKCDIENCKICSYPYEKNISKCLKCKENYILINEKCEKSNNKINHCMISQKSKCMLCENNYYLMEQKCIFDGKITDCLSYECMSCFNDKKRSEICEDGKLYNEVSKKCNDCNDQNCRICIDKIGCVICNEGLTLIEGKCLNSTYFANTIDGCALYDAKGNCLTCEEKCTLEDNECYCQNVTVIIILFCIIVVILIIFFVVFLRKKNQIREFQERQEANFKKEEIEFQLLAKAKLKDDIIDDILQKDSQLRKCYKCKNELAIIQLDCGCLLCKDDSKNLNIPSLKDHISINNNINNFESYEFEKPEIPEIKFGENELINENKQKSMEISTSSKQHLTYDINNKNKSSICPVCYKHFNSSKQIAFQCEICFDITSKLFNFNCGCALAVCKTCFNKIIKTKKCPGCRKDIISH